MVKKKNSGMAMGTVIIFVTVMSIVVTALLISSSAALRSARVMPQEDGNFFSAEATMNRGISGVATIMTGEDATYFVDNLQEAAFNELASDTPIAAVAGILQGSSAFAAAVQTEVDNFINTTFGTLPAPVGTAGWAGTVAQLTGPQRYFWHVGESATNETIRDNWLAVDGFAAPGFLYFRRDGTGPVVTNYTVSAVQIGANTLYVTVSPQVELRAYAASATVWRPLAWDFTSFILVRGNTSTGINNAGSFGDLSGAVGGAAEGIAILEYVPFIVSDTSPHRPAGTCDRLAAYNALRAGIAAALAEGIPTMAELFAYPGIPTVSGNAAFIGGNWVALPNIDNPGSWQPAYYAGDTGIRDVSDWIRANPDVQYLRLAQADGNHNLHGVINAPNLRAVYVDDNLVFAPNSSFTGRPEGRGTTFRASNLDINFAASGINTLANAEFRTISNTRINQSARVNASLQGNAVFINPGADNIVVGGNSFVMGSLAAAPQLITASHTTWAGNNGRFYGLMTSGTNQLNNTIGATLTFTGIMVRNLYHSDIGAIPPLGSGGHTLDGADRIPQTNNMVQPGPDLLLGGALNTYSRLMEEIYPYVGDGGNNTVGPPEWEVVTSTDHRATGFRMGI